MKTEPLQPAQIVFDDPAHPGQPYAPGYADAYHARLGAWAQAQPVQAPEQPLEQLWLAKLAPEPSASAALCSA